MADRGPCQGWRPGPTARTPKWRRTDCWWRDPVNPYLPWRFCRVFPPSLRTHRRIAGLSLSCGSSPRPPGRCSVRQRLCLARLFVPCVSTVLVGQHATFAFAFQLSRSNCLCGPPKLWLWLMVVVDGDVDDVVDVDVVDVDVDIVVVDVDVVDVDVDVVDVDVVVVDVDAFMSARPCLSVPSWRR